VAEKLFTLKQIAERICEMDARPEAEREIHQSLRYLQQSFGLLSARDANGPRGAWQFARSELCRARVFATLFDIGIPRERMVSVNAGLEAGYLSDGEDREDSHPRSALEWAIRGISKPTPESWSLNIDVMRDLTTGKIEFVGTVFRDDHLPDSLTRNVLDGSNAVQGERRQSTILLPLTSLLRPLLGATIA